MIRLSDRQADALAELVNIAFGLTAAKLSEVTGHRIHLKSPTITIHSPKGLADELRFSVSGEIATVHQVFSGPVSGHAIFLLNYKDAVELSNLLVEDHLRSQRFDSSTKEILTETGNMLLSACLGMFGNLLQVNVTFSIPYLQLASVEHFGRSISINGDELQCAIVITASFDIHEHGIAAGIAIVLGISSLERLIEAVERWETTGAEIR
jgi:chemotaxis protein CheC